MSVKLKIVFGGDILEQNTDAIVVPVSSDFQLNGKLGSQLKKRCSERFELEVSQAKNLPLSFCAIFNSYGLDCEKVILVNTPNWVDGKNREANYLVNSYINCMSLALKFGLKSIAFPVLSAGNNGFDEEVAIKVAFQAFDAFKNDLYVVFIILSDEIFYKNPRLFEKRDVEEAYSLLSEEEMGCYANTNELHALGVKPVSSSIRTIRTIPEWIKYYQFKKRLKTIDCYDGVISKTGFHKIINGVTIPDKYRLIALGINMGLKMDQIDNLLIPIGTKLDFQMPRDNIIIRGLRQGLTIEQINNDLISNKLQPLPTTRKIHKKS